MRKIIISISVTSLYFIIYYVEYIVISIRFHNKELRLENKAGKLGFGAVGMAIDEIHSLITTWVITTIFMVIILSIIISAARKVNESHYLIEALGIPRTFGISLLCLALFLVIISR